MKIHKPKLKNPMKGEVGNLHYEFVNFLLKRENTFQSLLVLIFFLFKKNIEHKKLYFVIVETLKN